VYVIVFYLFVSWTTYGLVQTDQAPAVFPSLDACETERLAVENRYNAGANVGPTSQLRGYCIKKS
jgi:hypothetical protein